METRSKDINMRDASAKQRGDKKPGKESEENQYEPQNDNRQWYHKNQRKRSIQEKRKSNKDKKKSNKISTKKCPLNLIAKKCVYEVLKDKNPNQMGLSKTSIPYMADIPRSSARNLKLKG